MQSIEKLEENHQLLSKSLSFAFEIGNFQLKEEKIVEDYDIKLRYLLYRVFCNQILGEWKHNMKVHLSLHRILGFQQNIEQLLNLNEHSFIYS